MQLNLANKIGLLLPARLADILLPSIIKIDEAFAGNDDDAVSRRMAMVVFSIRVCSAAIAFLSQVFLARWMGDFEYGIFVGVWVAAIIVAYGSCLGLPTGVVRFIAKYQETNEQDLLRGTILGGIGFAMFACLVVASLGTTFLYVFPTAIEEYYVLPVMLAALCLPLMALQEVQDGVSRAFNWPGTALVSTFIARPIMILLFMVVAIAAGYQPNAVVAMVATVIATYLASTGQFVMLFSKLRKVLPWGPVKMLPKEWLLVALPIFLAEGFYVLLTSVDILFVSKMMNPESVAVYFAAVKTLALVHFVYYAVKAASAHRFSAYSTSGNTQRYEQFVSQTVRWTFWPSLILALVMMVMGKYFLMLFGENFVSGSGIIVVLAVGIVLRASVGPAESVLTMSGQQNACAMVYVATLMVNIILNITLIPIFGLYGAAIATTAAMAYESLALFAMAKRRLGIYMFIIPASVFGLSQPATSVK